MIYLNKLKGAIYGLAIGDAIGVPYEFKHRGTFTCTDMIGFGTHNQPIGTWSDDTSLTLATLDSINKYNEEINYADIRKNFENWLHDGIYTPFGEVFDVGGTTAKAINIGYGINSEDANGNGSLMRILPLAFIENVTDEEIGNVSAITHAHAISKDACVQYVKVARNLLNGVTINEAINKGVGFSLNIGKYDETNIFSDGYVISTLWAALWSLATTNSYKECVLRAVNLGNDTDTVAAVAGGLAGIVYGFEEIPKEWVENLKGKEIIEKCLSMDKEITKEITNCNSEKDHLDFDESMTVAARTKERGTKNVRNLCER